MYDLPLNLYSKIFCSYLKVWTRILAYSYSTIMYSYSYSQLETSLTHMHMESQNGRRH